jgi:hypothetical protein
VKCTITFSKPFIFKNQKYKLYKWGFQWEEETPEMLRITTQVQRWLSINDLFELQKDFGVSSSH